jgi:hypothetical protein
MFYSSGKGDEEKKLSSNLRIKLFNETFQSQLDPFHTRILI